MCVFFFSELLSAVSPRFPATCAALQREPAAALPACSGAAVPATRSPGPCLRPLAGHQRLDHPAAAAVLTAGRARRARTRTRSRTKRAAYPSARRLQIPVRGGEASSIVRADAGRRGVSRCGTTWPSGRQFLPVRQADLRGGRQARIDPLSAAGSRAASDGAACIGVPLPRWSLGRVSVARRSRNSSLASRAALRGSAAPPARRGHHQPGFVLRLPLRPLRTLEAKLIVLSL